MALMQLKSDNPMFSFIIKKNPSSPMQIKSMKKGKVFSWYTISNDQEYNIYFEDSPHEVSFKKYPDQEFEYLDTAQYSSPYFVLYSITEFFKTTLVKQNEYDEDVKYKNELRINLLEVKRTKNIDFFNLCFENLSIEYEEKNPKHFELIFKTSDSLYKLLNYVMSFCILSLICNNNKVHLNSNFVRKYIGCLNRSDSPYFIKYLFKKNLLRSKCSFKKEAKLLQETNRYYDLKFEFGDTQKARADVIRNLLSIPTKTRGLIDIGCGEGYYINEFAGQINPYYYIAIDTDPDERKKAEYKVSKNNLDNVIILKSIDELNFMNLNDKYDVLLTEVIEHMPVEEGFNLIKNVLSHDKVEKLIITTPNKDFNKFYSLEEEFRHSDHLFEFTEKEFRNWSENFKNEIERNLTFNYFYAGDRVNNIHTCLGLLISKGV